MLCAHATPSVVRSRHQVNGATFLLRLTQATAIFYQFAEVVAAILILNSKAPVCNLRLAERIANVIAKNLCSLFLEINAFRATFLSTFSNFSCKG